MEPGTQVQNAPEAAREKTALRRAGAVRWEPACVVRRTRVEVLSDEHGRRCDQPDGGAVQRTRDDLVGSSGVAQMGEQVWHSQGAVYGLEERVREGTDSAAGTAWRSSGDAVRAHVRQAGHPDYRGQFPASQGTRGTKPRHASGSA